MIHRLFILYQNGMKIDDIHRVYLHNDDELLLILMREFIIRNKKIQEDQVYERINHEKRLAEHHEKIAEKNQMIDCLWLELYDTMRQRLANVHSEMERLYIFIDSAERLGIPPSNRQTIFTMLTQDIPPALC